MINSSCSVMVQPIHGMNIKYLPGDDLGEQLNYLLAFENNDTLCPFKESHEKTFLSARKWTKVNNRSLNIGLFGCTALSVAPAFLGLNAVQDWENASLSNSAKMFIVVTLYAGLIGMINYVCTGTLPDKAATQSIKGTAITIEIEKCYEKIALSLFDIFEKDENKGRSIANRINIQNIQIAMERYVSTEVSKTNCAYLHYVKDFVLTGQQSKDAPISVSQGVKILKLTKLLQSPSFASSGEEKKG